MGQKSTEVISAGTAYFLLILSFIAALGGPTVWLWILLKLFKIEGTGILNALLVSVLCWVVILGTFYGAGKTEDFLKDPTLIKEVKWFVRVLIDFVLFTILILFLLHTDYLRRALIFSIIHTVALYFWIGAIYKFLESNGVIRTVWDVSTKKVH
ncbi:MAG: hypothetical protein N2234_00780 [Planctomycetota bacterium]|nr:hypothetical protein [Planctomycetota bacterium]